MRLAIDASNARAQGGVTYLRELLGAARPARSDFDRVTVYSGTLTAGRLPQKPWLDVVTPAALDGNLLARTHWQRRRLHRLARGCDLLFVPGGRYGGDFTPFVALSQNMLPFDPKGRSLHGRPVGRARVALLRTAQIRTFVRAAGVIFLSDYAAETINRALPVRPARQAIIPHGLASGFLNRRDGHRRIDDCSEHRPFRWLYVSSVHPYKHPWQVVRAIAQLRRTGLPVRLDLVGPARTAIARLEEAINDADPGDEFVTWHGEVDYEALPEWYTRADAFVFASSCENFPITVLEAAGAGLPIACNRVRPMRDTLGDAAAWFDVTHVDDIAACLERITTDAELRSRLGNEAFELARGYSWQRTADQTFEFLRATVAT